MSDELIDRIYECSFLPERWPGVMDELAREAGARGGQVFSVRGKAIGWAGSEELRDVFDRYFRDGWFAQCNRGVCIMGEKQPKFFREYDFWSESELDAVPIYRDFFRPNGLGWSASTGIRLPTGDNLVLTIERDFARGPLDSAMVDRLDELRPHLARSAFISSRLGLKHAEGASDMLATLGLPALLIAEDGRVVEANRLAEDLTDCLQWRVRDSVAFNDRRTNALLVKAVTALHADNSTSTQSFPVRSSQDGHVELVAHLIPIRGSAHELFGNSYMLLALMPITPQTGPPIDLVRSLFDFTIAEARVARALAQGSSLEEIAATGSVAISTVRSQLRRILEKTGCTRQAEVVAVLAGVSLDRAR